MSDDLRRSGAAIELIGYMVIHSLSKLKDQQVFRPDSDVRNLGLILAMLIHWGYNTPSHLRRSASWVSQVIKLAEKNGVGLYGPSNIVDVLERIKHTEVSEDLSWQWVDFDWAGKVRANDDIVPCQMSTNRFEVCFI